MGDDFAAYREHKKELRAKYGVPCPVCVVKLPKAHPKILMPGEFCKMHKYRDQRPELTDEQWQNETTWRKIN